MDQRTADEALRKLDPLVGAWTLQVRPSDGESLPGGGRSTFEWHPSGAYLVQQTIVDVPEAPDSLCIVGCDAASGTYVQLYSDQRGVSRVYQMSIAAGEWKLWRTGEPFAQRFSATFSEDANTLLGRWEMSENGVDYAHDFDLIYRRSST